MRKEIIAQAFVNGFCQLLLVSSLASKRSSLLLLIKPVSTILTGYPANAERRDSRVLVGVMYFANALQLTDHTGRYIIPYRWE